VDFTFSAERNAIRDTARRVAPGCLSTHGHGGYRTDPSHQQWLRDVLGLQSGDGTEQVQKMIIARGKVGRMAVPYA